MSLMLESRKIPYSLSLVSLQSLVMEYLVVSMNFAAVSEFSVNLKLKKNCNIFPQTSVGGLLHCQIASWFYHSIHTCMYTFPNHYHQEHFCDAVDLQQSIVKKPKLSTVRNSEVNAKVVLHQ